MVMMRYVFILLILFVLTAIGLNVKTKEPFEESIRGAAIIWIAIITLTLIIYAFVKFW
jgi:hypothetical protein